MYFILRSWRAITNKQKNFNTVVRPLMLTRFFVAINVSVFQTSHLFMNKINIKTDISFVTQQVHLCFKDCASVIKIKNELDSLIR